jgi:hypothetical protein
LFPGYLGRTKPIYSSAAKSPGSGAAAGEAATATLTALAMTRSVGTWREGYTSILTLLILFSRRS